MSDAPFPCLGDIIAGKNMEMGFADFPLLSKGLHLCRPLQVFPFVMFRH